jgi:small subunit ribosomal protein S19
MSKNNKNLNYKLFNSVLFEKYSGFNKQKRGFIKSYYRSTVIHEIFIGFLFFVHNGQNFKPVEITDEMVGHKFGEFSTTRFCNHNLKKKNLKKSLKNKWEEKHL